MMQKRRVTDVGLAFQLPACQGETSVGIGTPLHRFLANSNIKEISIMEENRHEENKHEEKIGADVKHVFTLICKTVAVFCKTAVVFFAAVIMAACNGNRSASRMGGCDTVSADGGAAFVLGHMAVDKRRVMPYVTCTGQTVDSLLAIADTVCSQAGTRRLADLDMGTESQNASIAKCYGDTISVVLSLFSSYARMVNSGFDEADAAFVWHEVARTQMRQFYSSTGGEWHEPQGSEAVFGVIDGMMGRYGGGTQQDMNLAAWRSAMPVDYRLIEAYKRLDDLCGSTSVVRLVHDDYAHMLKTFRAYCSSVDEWYSDLPREQGEMFRLMLQFKLKLVQRLVYRRGKGRIGNSAVEHSLREHRIIWFGKDVRLTVDLLNG